MESAGDCEKIRMKRLFKRITALASAAALTLSLAACGGSAVSGPKNTAPTNAKPVTITVWSYYNGDQLETFSKLVDEFNATVGKEQNITVEASSQGSVNDLETNVLAAAEGKVGAAEMPNILLRLCRHLLCRGPDGPCGGPERLPDRRGKSGVPGELSHRGRL